MKVKTIAILVTILASVGGFLGILLYNNLVNQASLANEENSVNSAEISFTSLALGASNSQVFLSDLTTYRKFEFVLSYTTSGGSILLTCRDFVLTVKIEDLNIGSIRISDFLMQSGSQGKTENCTLDLSHTSTNDLSYVQNKLYKPYHEELKVEIQGSATINASTKARNISPQISRYFLLESSQIALGNVYWEKTYASTGEAVNFHVEYSNPYRASQTYGMLRVDVINDFGYGYDLPRICMTDSTVVSLNAGRSRDYIQPFTVFNATKIRGWFLKIYWNELLIYTMSHDSPPELRRYPW